MKGKVGVIGLTNNDQGNSDQHISTRKYKIDTVQVIFVTYVKK